MPPACASAAAAAASSASAEAMDARLGPEGSSAPSTSGQAQIGMAAAGTGSMRGLVVLRHLAGAHWQHAAAVCGGAGCRHPSHLVLLGQHMRRTTPARLLGLVGWGGVA
jgi:hypothetical protein